MNYDKEDEIADKVLSELCRIYPAQLYVGEFLEQQFGFLELDFFPIVDKLKAEGLAQLLDNGGDRMIPTYFGRKVWKSGGWLRHLGKKEQEKIKLL